MIISFIVITASCENTIDSFENLTQKKSDIFQKEKLDENKNVEENTSLDTESIEKTNEIKPKHVREVLPFEFKDIKFVSVHKGEDRTVIKDKMYDQKSIFFQGLRHLQYDSDAHISKFKENIKNAIYIR